MLDESVVKLDSAGMEERISAKHTSSVDLVGKSIVQPVEVEGKEVKAFLDSGSQVSTINEALAKELS